MTNYFLKSILFFLLTIELVIASAGTECTAASFITNSDKCKRVSIKPRVSISFVIARRRDCLGFGICDLSFEIISGKVNAGTGVLYTDPASRNMIVLEIDKSKDISSESYEKYFASGVFVMEDDFPIPGDILAEMGIKGTLTMRSGNHRITEKNGILYVSIPVR